MFVTTCLNENNQLYLLAINGLRFRNSDVWEWLHGVISDRLGLVIIFDRCTCKESYFEGLLKCYHGISFFHLKSNIKLKFRMSKTIWDEFESAFIKATKTCELKNLKTT